MGGKGHTRATVFSVLQHRIRFRTAYRQTNVNNGMGNVPLITS
jgi:hypothetical protein